MSVEVNRRVYDRWADQYETDDNPLLLLEGPAVRALLPADLAGRSVLELGAGTGRHAPEVLARGGRYAGLEASPGMLAHARRRLAGTGARLFECDLEEPWPVAGERFDVLVCALVVEHLRELPAFFARCRDVARPDAVLVLSAMHPALFLRDTNAGFLDPETGQKVRALSYPHSMADMINAALAAGFDLERLVEQSVDAALAAVSPRAARYLGWPLLFALRARATR